MANQLTASIIKKTMLEVVGEHSGKSNGSMQQVSILNGVTDRLGIRGQRDLDTEQAILTVWNDLFREGHLAWGYNLLNSDPPFCHVTTRGRESLKNMSRDPANPDGCMAYLIRETTLNPVAESYIREALRSYNSNCYKAAAVMVGCASESLLLELRDKLVVKMENMDLTVPKRFKDWRIRPVTKAIGDEINKHKHKMKRDLLEPLESYWTAFVQQIRAIRNDAGHPLSVGPVTSQSVHASLLIFPELTILNAELCGWLQESLG